MYVSKQHKIETLEVVNSHAIAFYDVASFGYGIVYSPVKKGDLYLRIFEGQRVVFHTIEHRPVVKIHISEPNYGGIFTVLQPWVVQRVYYRCERVQAVGVVQVGVVVARYHQHRSQFAQSVEKLLYLVEKFGSYVSL